MYLAQHELILEVVVEKNETTLNPDVSISNLSLGLHIHLLWNNSVIENWEYYRKAMGGLKKLMPKLENVKPSGGHSYHPKNGVQVLYYKSFNQSF